MEGGAIPEQVELVVKEAKFSCKRELLAHHSAYFYAMFNNDFKEKHQEQITLEDVEPESLEFIINCISNNAVDFTQTNNILEILETSCMLQFDQIQKDCIKFIIQSWLDKETWLTTSNVADRLGLAELKHKTRTLALWNFSEVRRTQHFLQLSPDELIGYLSDDKLRTTEGEFEVFEAGVNWIEYCPDDRLFYALPLLKTVRFRDMDTFDIRSMLHFSSVRDTPQVELIVECIVEMKDGVLNHSCESCNADDDNTRGSGNSSPLPSGVLFKNLKRKRRTTSHCTCFDGTTVREAEELLSRPSRRLPLLPCVVASCSLGLEIIHSPQIKKNKCPHVFVWNDEKLKPLIHLAKIDEGPSEALGYKVVIKDLKMYVIGGEYMMGHGEWNTSIWCYDTWKEMWQFETSLPSPRRHHSALVIDNDLFIIGGVGRHRVMLDSVAKYSLVTKSWENCAPLPTTLYSAACCAHKEDIYVFGAHVFCYRRSVAAWEVLSNITMPDKMAVVTAMSDGQTIYVITINKNLCSFVPQPTDVEVKVLGQFRLIGSNACLVNDSIFSFGEEDGGQSIEEYSLRSRTFTTHLLSDTSTLTLGHGAGCFPLPKYY